MVYDQHEWDKTLDTEGILRNAIRFRLVSISDLVSANSVTTNQVRELDKLAFEELRSRAYEDVGRPLGDNKKMANVHYRSYAVKKYVLSRAEGSCEACDDSAPFNTAKGDPYLETHHIRRLSDGGDDLPQWVIGVCPNCHRRAHYADDNDAFNERLKNIIADKESKIKE